MIHCFRLTLFTILLAVSASGDLKAEAPILPESLELIDPIPNALSVFISQKGMDYFEENSRKILALNGLQFEKYYFEKIENTQDEQSTEDLVSESNKGTVRKIKSQLIELFKNFPSDNHKFRYTLNGLFINTEWDKVDLKIFDPTQREDFSDEDYLIGLDIQLQATNVKVGLDGFRMTDLNNSWLGDIGGDQISLTHGQPLAAALSIALYRDYNGDFKIKVSKPSTNINQMTLGVEYQSPLIIPEVSISVKNNRGELTQFELNKDVIEEYFNKEEEMLMEYLGDLIHGLAEKLLPEVIASSFSESVGDYRIQFLQELAPPNAPSGDVTPIAYLFDLDRFDNTNNSVGLVFDGKVIDLEQDQSDLQSPRFNYPYTADGMIDRNDHPEMEDHDVSISLNVEFFNQLVRTSYERGYISEFDVKGEDDDGNEVSTKLHVRSSPLVYYSEENERMMIKLNLGAVLEGSEKLAAKKKFDRELLFSMDVSLGIELLENNKMKLFIDGIDLNNTELNKESITFLGWLLGAKKKLKGSLEEGHQSLQVENLVLVEALELPSNVLGVDLEAKLVSLDPKGYVLLHLNHKEEVE